MQSTSEIDSASNQAPSKPIFYAKPSTSSNAVRQNIKLSSESGGYKALQQAKIERLNARVVTTNEGMSLRLADPVLEKDRQRHVRVKELINHGRFKEAQHKQSKQHGHTAIYRQDL